MDVLTMGTFDALHPGHVGLFRACRELADGGMVRVAVNSDAFVQKFKHVVPIFSAAERVETVQACRYVDGTAINSGAEQPRIIAEALPAGGALVVGDDWARKDYLAQIGLAGDREFLDRHAVRLVYVARTGEWSTTEIRSRLA